MTLVAVKENEKTAIRGLRGPASDEVVVFCPGCKAIQTVQLSGKQLIPTRKFNQVGPYIYHDCGSRLPCRLYQNL